MKRGGFLRRSATLARGKRLRPVSRKRRRLDRTDTVRAVVFARAGGRCEVEIVETIYYPIGQRPVVFAEPYPVRCIARAEDLAHLRKPRRAPRNHTPALTFAACRPHHDRQGEQQPYSKGRIVVTPWGDGTFTFRMVYAADKFVQRETARP